MTHKPLLSARGLTTRFGERPVLRDVDLDAAAGELVAVLGPSGAGKTTLFRCLTGLLAPDSGSVAVEGVSAASFRGRQRRQIGVVFQQFNLIKRRTALENVLAGRLGYGPVWRGWLGRFGAADHRLAMDCLDRVGLADLAGQRASTLSGGQQQRVAIARALAQQPRLIVADEPVASLDPESSAGILDLLRGIARADGLAVVCSLHQVGYARDYANRIVGLSHGRVSVDVAADGFGAAVYARVYAGPDEAETLSISDATVPQRWS